MKLLLGPVELNLMPYYSCESLLFFNLCTWQIVKTYKINCKCQRDVCTC